MKSRLKTGKSVTFFTVQASHTAIRYANHMATLLKNAEAENSATLLWRGPNGM